MDVIKLYDAPPVMDPASCIYDAERQCLHPCTTCAFLVREAYIVEHCRLPSCVYCQECTRRPYSRVDYRPAGVLNPESRARDAACPPAAARQRCARVSRQTSKQVNQMDLTSTFSDKKTLLMIAAAAVVALVLFKGRSN